MYFLGNKIILFLFPLRSAITTKKVILDLQSVGLIAWGDTYITGQCSVMSMVEYRAMQLLTKLSITCLLN